MGRWKLGVGREGRLRASSPRLPWCRARWQLSFIPVIPREGSLGGGHGFLWALPWPLRHLLRETQATARLLPSLCMLPWPAHPRTSQPPPGVISCSCSSWLGWATGLGPSSPAPACACEGKAWEYQDPFCSEAA